MKLRDLPSFPSVSIKNRRLSAKEKWIWLQAAEEIGNIEVEVDKIKLSSILFKYIVVEKGRLLFKYIVVEKGRHQGTKLTQAIADNIQEVLK